MSLIVSKLPDYYYDFKNKKRYPIYRRTPAILSSDADFAVGANGVPFPTEDLTNSRDLVFEFTTVNLRAYFLDETNEPVADPPGVALPTTNTTNPARATVFGEVSILDTSSNQPVLEDPVAINALVDENTQNWELPRPYYLPTTKQWQVKGSNTHPSYPIEITIVLRGSWLHMGQAQDYDGPEM